VHATAKGNPAVITIGRVLHPITDDSAAKMLDTRQEDEQDV
jgi:hypothetical protein